MLRIGRTDGHVYLQQITEEGSVFELVPTQADKERADGLYDDNWKPIEEPTLRDEFREEDHPREANGQFGEGGGESPSFKERDTLAQPYGSGEKTHEELGAAQPAFNAAEKAAISVYSDHNFKGTPDYVKINQGLRNGSTLSAGLQKTVDNLDKAMDRTSTPHDTVVYRAVRDVKGDIPEPKVGDHFTEKAYTSTSTEWSNASDFQQIGAKNHYMMRISVPKGSKAIAFTKGLSKNPREREVLIHRNAGFHVTKVETVTLKGGRGERKLYHVSLTA